MEKHLITHHLPDLQRHGSTIVYCEPRAMAARPGPEDKSASAPAMAWKGGVAKQPALLGVAIIPVMGRASQVDLSIQVAAHNQQRQLKQEAAQK